MKRNRSTREKRKQPRLHAKLSVPYKSRKKIVNSSSNGIRHIFMSNVDMKRRIENAGSTPWRERRRQSGGKPPNIRQRWRKRRRFGASRARTKNAGSAIDGNGRSRISGIPRIFRNRCACMPGDDCAARHPESDIAPGAFGRIVEWKAGLTVRFSASGRIGRQRSITNALRIHCVCTAHQRTRPDRRRAADRANVRCADRRNDRPARAGRGGARPLQPLTARGTSATSSTCRSPCNPASAPRC